MIQAIRRRSDSELFKPYSICQRQCLAKSCRSSASWTGSEGPYESCEKLEWSKKCCSSILGLPSWAMMYADTCLLHPKPVSCRGLSMLEHTRSGPPFAKSRCIPRTGKPQCLTLFHQMASTLWNRPLLSLCPTPTPKTGNSANSQPRALKPQHAPRKSLQWPRSRTIASEPPMCLG